MTSPAQQALVTQTADKRRLPKPPRRVASGEMPRTFERRYTTELLWYVNTAKQLLDQLLVPRLPELQAAAGLVVDAARLDESWDELLAQIMIVARGSFEQITGQRPVQTAEQMANEVDPAQKKVIVRQLKQLLGVDIFLDDSNLAAVINPFIATNVKYIKTIPRDYFDDVEQTVLRGFRSGKRADEVADELVQRTGVSRSKARVIARDQMNKLWGDLTRHRQTQAGLNEYRWRTAGDERVRTSHKRLNNKVFSWNKPPAVGHPGEPIQCRCWAEPLIDDLIDDIERQANERLAAQGLDPFGEGLAAAATKPAPPPPAPILTRLQQAAGLVNMKWQAPGGGAPGQAFFISSNQTSGMYSIRQTFTGKNQGRVSLVFDPAGVDEADLLKKRQRIASLTFNDDVTREAVREQLQKQAAEHMVDNLKASQVANAFKADDPLASALANAFIENTKPTAQAAGSRRAALKRAGVIWKNGKWQLAEKAKPPAAPPPPDDLTPAALSKAEGIEYMNHKMAADKPFNPKRLLASIKSPVRTKRAHGVTKATVNLKPGEQAEVLRQVNAITQAEGMVNKDILENKIMAGRLKVTQGKRAVGWHSGFNGELAMTRDRFDQLANLLDNTIPILAGQKTGVPTMSDLNGLRTLLHETGHASTPMHWSIYDKVGRVEEATTELAARLMLQRELKRQTGRNFNVLSGKVTNPIDGTTATVGSYPTFVDDLLDVVGSHVAMAGDMPREKLVEAVAQASIDMRKGTKVFKNPTEYFEHFARQLEGKVPGVDDLVDVDVLAKKIEDKLGGSTKKRRRRR